MAWHPHTELDLAQWVENGRRLGTVGRYVAWWIGDWLLYGNARYGERYTRAAKITGYDVQSLMNMVWVASRFDANRRRPDLSWSHHAEVAALSEDEQESWLNLAEAERLSVRCLRDEVRGAKRASLARTPSEAKKIVCPQCGYHLPDS